MKVKHVGFLKPDSRARKIFNFLVHVGIWGVVIFSMLYTWKYPEMVKRIFPELDLPKVSLANILQALIFVSLVLYVFRFFKRMIIRWVEKHPQEDKSVFYSLVKLIGYIGWIIALWGMLSFFGLKLQNLAIVLGALSVGVGFGMQNIINNFVSGLLLLFERPIAVGDWIQVDGQEGVVKNIRIRATELETFDKSSVLIPNSSILSGNVLNITKPNKSGRIVFRVGVSYDSDMNKVHQILKDCVQKTDGVLQSPAAMILMNDFADSAVVFEIRAYIKDVNNTLSVRSALMFAVWNALQENGIEIPFPQQVVHMKK